MSPSTQQALDHEVLYLRTHSDRAVRAWYSLHAQLPTVIEILDTIEGLGLYPGILTYSSNASISCSLSVSSFSDPHLIKVLEALELWGTFSSSDQPAENLRSYRLTLAPEDYPIELAVHAQLEDNSICQRVLVRVEKGHEYKSVSVDVEKPIWEFRCPPAEEPSDANS